MGIQGLIPFLEKFSCPVNISEYSGCTVAVDAYCWLHKGAFSCAEKLARGEDCSSYVYYCLKLVNMLLSHDIKPILVFDGQHLVAKSDTEKKRHEAREMNRKKGAELLRLDRGKEALTYLRRSVNITHEMALNVIKECRKRNVDCIVAPYEADAQLAYFSICGIADIVVTEDSDLLLFGAKKVIFKMDMNGLGLLVEQDKLHLAMGIRKENFCFDKFRQMCILSGCDYLPSLPGIGLAKACRFMKRVSDPDICRAISRIGSYLNMSQMCVSAEYKQGFVFAEATFKHQPVFDPFEKRIVPLTPFQKNGGNVLSANIIPDYLLNVPLSGQEALQLAYGNLDPFTLQQVDTWDPHSCQKQSIMAKTTTSKMRVAAHPSIWRSDYHQLWNVYKNKRNVGKEKTADLPPSGLTRKSVLIKDVKIQQQQRVSGNSTNDKTQMEINAKQYFEKLVQTYQTLGAGNEFQQRDENCITDDEDIGNEQMMRSEISGVMLNSEYLTEEEEESYFTEDENRSCGGDGSISKIDSKKRRLSATACETSTASSQTTRVVVSRCYQYLLIIWAYVEIMCRQFLRYFWSQSNEKCEVIPLASNGNVETKPTEERVSNVPRTECDKIKGQHSPSEKMKKKPLTENSVNVETSSINNSSDNDNDIPVSPVLNSSRKRNPFKMKYSNIPTTTATTTTAAVGKRRKSTFKWTTSDEDAMTVVMKTTSPVRSEYKSPRARNNTPEIRETVMDVDEETDEGFCSAGRAMEQHQEQESNSTLNTEGMKKSEIATSSCRVSGLTKRKQLTNVKQQSLLSMFGFRKPQNLKV